MDGPIEFVLIDIDGTMLGTAGIVPDGTWEAIEEAKTAGLRIALCTGRPGFGVEHEFLRRVSDEPHILQSGAVLATAEPETARLKVIEATSLPQEALQEIVALTRREARAIEAYTARGLYLERRDELTDAHAKLIEVEPMWADLLALGNEPGNEPQNKIVRLQWVLKPKDWADIKTVMDHIAEVEVSVATSPGLPGLIFASVTKRGVSKLEMAKILAEREGITLNQMAMIGDGEGDLELIRASGLGIAMGNAGEHVKAGADIVVSSVDDGGLIEALEKLKHSRNQ